MIGGVLVLVPAFDLFVGRYYEEKFDLISYIVFKFVKCSKGENNIFTRRKISFYVSIERQDLHFCRVTSNGIHSNVRLLNVADGRYVRSPVIALDHDRYDVGWCRLLGLRRRRYVDLLRLRNLILRAGLTPSLLMMDARLSLELMMSGFLFHRENRRSVFDL